MQFTKEELEDLILGALAEFGHHDCPYCQAEISLAKYIKPDDISQWLEKRLKEDLCET